jgi:hypothetical protein
MALEFAIAALLLLLLLLLSPAALCVRVFLGVRMPLRFALERFT